MSISKLDMKSYLPILLLRSALFVHAWWKPAAGTSWQIVLSKPIPEPYPNVTALDFDLFDNPASTITALHQAGQKAICYFSAGSYERWRSDADQFAPADLGEPLDGWPGERWLNTSSANVRKIMQARMDLATQKGCDAIDPDNTDVYDNGGGGFNLQPEDAVNYVQFLASEGHKRGLAVGLKNSGTILEQVLGDVDFQVNEQCLQYGECDTFRPFINAGKPVFEIEYRKGMPTAAQTNDICSNSERSGFSTLVKHTSLDDYYFACPGNSITSSTPAQASASASRNAAVDLSIRPFMITGLITVFVLASSVI